MRSLIRRNELARVFFVIVGGTLVISVINLISPFFSIMASICIGGIACYLIFLYPGELTLRRDLTLFVSLALIWWLRQQFIGFICALPVTYWHCDDLSYLRLEAGFHLAGLLVFQVLIWSWIRFRTIRHRLSTILRRQGRYKTYINYAYGQFDVLYVSENDLVNDSD